MTLLASDVMDEASVLLNDVGKSLYTYTVQLPYLKKANEDLEQELIVYGSPTQRMASAAITVLANSKTLTLPTDFLLPTRLFERTAGSSDSWGLPMIEKIFLPEDEVVGNTLQYWQFANNNINFLGALVNRDVLLEYERTLAVIQSENSAEDLYLAKPFLAARTAELCARYIGMNKLMADDIKEMETDPARDSLVRNFVLINQGNPVRRPRFSTGRLSVR